ncbi:MAG: hypothetical protein KF768_12900 [Phycisphaeraceae bacterium]|nr:hypothetical protein [Phycisphaeraceae bacterium]
MVRLRAWIDRAVLGVVGVVAVAVVVGGVAAASAGAGVESQPGVGGAGSGGGGGGGMRRFVRSFDFEEEDHPDPVPPGWLWAQEDPTPVVDPRGRVDGAGRPVMVPRVVRPGFPAFNRAEYDRTVAASGRASVRLPTRGGSTALRLMAGEVPVFSDADYGVSARVRTRGVRHARAFVSARLLDSSLRPIEGSHVRSVGVSDRETGAAADGWVSVSVAIPGKFAGAAWLQVELELLQAREHSAGSALGAHAIREEDLRADAWFDDVLVFLQPRALVRAAHAFNVAQGRERPTLEVAVRDLGGDALTARVTVTDLDGQRVAVREMEVDPSGLPMRWEPSLPGYGWYTARLDVLAGVNGGGGVGGAETGRTVVVASDRRAFAWLSPGSDAKRARSGAENADLKRVGVVLDSGDDGELTADVSTALALGARLALVPAWWAGTTREGAASALAARTGVLDSLLNAGVDVTLCVERWPEQVVEGGLSDPYDLAACLSSSVEGNGEVGGAGAWELYLRPTLDRYGQRILRYQLGRAGREELFNRPGLDLALTRFEESVSRLVPGPTITLGWRADQALHRAQRVARAEEEAGTDAHRRAQRTRKPTGPLVDAVTLLYPSSFPSSVMMEAVEPWLGGEAGAGGDGGAPEITLVVELAGEAGIPLRAGPRELVRRMVRAWELHNRTGRGGGDVPAMRIAVERPWKRVSERVGVSEPEPAWPALAFAADALAGRRIVGTLPGEAGTVAFILAGQDERTGRLTRGALVAWNEHAEPEMARLNVEALGEELRIVDCFGNERGLSEGERAEGLALGEMPVFVEGIDANLALFVAGFSVEPRFVRSSVKEHEHAIILTNPWPIRITGSLQIREAAEGDGKARRSTWNITPAGVLDFAIGPNERRRIPFTFTFGPGQVVGAKRLEVLARVSAEREHPLLKLKFTLDVGLEDLQLELEAARSPTNTGPDLVVTAAITNQAGRSRTLRVEAATRDHPTQQLQVSDLGTGQTVIRRFVFKDAGGARSSGRAVIVSVSDLEEADRLNKVVEVR